MADCPKNTIDANVSGLRIAEEECLGQLPGVDGADAVWYPQEPNSYSDFGASVTTTARQPINESRQRQMGSVTDLDAAGGYNQDFTPANSLRLMQGFFFADARELPSTSPLSGPYVAVDGVEDGAYATVAGESFKVGDLVLATGFGNPANNGVKAVTAADATSVTAAGLVDEPTGAGTGALSVVGVQAPAGDLSLAMNGPLVRLVSAGAIDFTALGLVPGGWVFVGGNAVANRFSRHGFARVARFTEDYAEFDKVRWLTPEADAGAGKTIQLFLPTTIKNEKDPDLIKTRSYQLERTLGRDAVGMQAEYIIGAIANEWTLNVPQADKIAADLTFVAMDAEYRTGTEGLKVGARPNLPVMSAINTSSDLVSIKLAAVAEDANVTPLFTYASDLTLTISNNASGVKALGHLGGVDVSVGNIDVGGELTVYFRDVSGPRAVRNNLGVTLDVAFVRDGYGLVFDVPLLTLGNGQAALEMGQKITLPLETNAAESAFGHTFLMAYFPFLPAVAKPVR